MDDLTTINHHNALSLKEREKQEWDAQHGALLAEHAAVIEQMFFSCSGWIGHHFERTNRLARECQGAVSSLGVVFKWLSFCRKGSKMRRRFNGPTGRPWTGADVVILTWTVMSFKSLV